MSSEPTTRPDIWYLPPAFIRDCEECGVDVGFYDYGPNMLIGPSIEQMTNLRERAEFYVHPDGPDQCPRGLKAAARALLKRMDAYEIPYRFTGGKK